MGPPHYFTCFIYFHGSFHESKFTSMEIYVEVGESFHGSTWQFPLSMKVRVLTSMEISMQVGGSIFTSMECSQKPPWKNMEVSTVGGSGSFHCFHQRQFPQIVSVEASMNFDIPLRNSTYSHQCHKLPDVSTRLTLTLSWSYLHGSWPISNLHESWWKLSWKQMDVDGSFHGS